MALTDQERHRLDALAEIAAGENRDAPISMVVFSRWLGTW
jgi:hypothetical protein